jgi:hypothetical protein
VLAAGLRGATALIAAGVTGVELIDHGVLPGKAKLDALDGACSVPRPVLVYSPTGPSFSGTFYSAARFVEQEPSSLAFLARHLVT